MNCIDCSRPLRPQGTSVDNHPGTHVAFPGPRCSSCYKVGPRSGHKKPAGHCRECKRPMRGTRQTLEERPGTVRHAGRDLCISCHTAERDGRKVRLRVPVSEVPVVEDPALMGYLNQRRKRKAAQDAAAVRIRAYRGRPAPIAVVPVRPRVDLDRTTGLWVMSKGGAVIGLAVSKNLAWEQLRDLSRMAVAA